MSSFAKTETKEVEPVAGTSESVLVPATTATTSVPVVIPKEPEVDRTVAYKPSKADEDAHEMLLEMLTYRRPARSKSEAKFINRFIIPLKVEVDKYGNYYKRIGKAPVVWCCHLDTVHTEGGRQKLGYDMAEVGIAEKEKSSCLGADDTAGVWLMVQMITAKVPPPGLYIFHRDEEGGRKGSEFIAKYMPSQLDGMKFAIALDRKGVTSIITHQMSKRCCSGEFADSLASELDMGFLLDDTGSYTDTASYVGIIGECTNLSVGYHNAHSSFERQDREFLFKLRDKLLKLDVAKLDNCRKAGTVEYKTYTSTYLGTSTGRSSHYYYGGEGDDDYSQWQQGYWDGNKWIEPKKSLVAELGGHPNSHGVRRSSATGVNGTGRTEYGSPANKCVSDDDDEPTHDVDIVKDYEKMVKCITRNPEAVADILEQMGYGYEELSAEILQAGVLNY